MHGQQNIKKRLRESMSPVSEGHFLKSL